VTCGVCGEAVDVLGGDNDEPHGAHSDPHGMGTLGSQQLFIVARGHPELVEQLKSVMGHQGDVRIIEDRRRQPREAPPAEEQAREMRKRLREEGEV
jgi:hypothetical protein